MRVLSPVVQVSTGSMPHIGQYLTMRNPVAAQAIGDDTLRLVLQADEQALEEALGRRRVPPVLHQDVEHDTVLVHRAPETVQLAVDAQENLILLANSTRQRQSCKSGHARLGPWHTVKPPHHA
jgi:hypothetical protein